MYTFCSIIPFQSYNPKRRGSSATPGAGPLPDAPPAYSKSIGNYASLTIVFINTKTFK